MMVAKVGTRVDVSTQTDEQTDINFWLVNFGWTSGFFLVYLSMDK